MLLRQELARPGRDEWAGLHLAHRDLAWVREVVLYCADTPMVFAHSVLPRGGVRGAWHLVAGLGTRPLGAVLFADPLIRRMPFAFHRIDARHALYHKAVAPPTTMVLRRPRELWARRSVFRRGGRPILVTESFSARNPEAALMTLLERLTLYERLMRLDKPIGILLLLWPTLWGLWIAADGRPGWLLVWIFVLGTVLMRSAGCVINDYADRNFDPHVERTRNRPLATGAVSTQEALILFALLSLAAALLILPLQPPGLAAGGGRACSWPRAIRSPSASSPSRRPISASPSASAYPWPSPRHLDTVPPVAWALLAGERVLGRRLRHGVRNGGPRRRHPHRHQAPRP